MNKLTILNKKGSTSVWLLLIFASFIVVVSVFVSRATEVASDSYVDSVFELAGRSILSEYNNRLLQEYGLFVYKGDVSKVENKLVFYANSSFEKNQREIFYEKNIDLLNIELQGIKVDLKEFSIVNVDNFEKQILEFMRFRILNNILFEDKMINKNESVEVIELKNKKISNSLPSRGYGGSSIDITKILDRGIPSISEMKDNSIKSFYINEYILNVFQNHRTGYEQRRSFFTNEVEYILCGKLNDGQNYKRVRTYLIVLRTGLNLAHIYSDSTKREQVIALAEIMTPGPGALATQLVIATTWAGAEAENDAKLLEEGGNVSLWKSKHHWALDLEGIMKGDKSNKAIEPENKSGQAYVDYLRLLLFFQSREIKLLRCMDLIHLNMKGNYNRDFDLKDYYGGFYFEALVKNKKYNYVQKY